MVMGAVGRTSPGGAGAGDVAEPVLQVTDRNTGEPLDGATVGVAGADGAQVVTATDERTGPGSYRLFSPLSHAQELEITADRYARGTAAVDVVPDGVVRKDVRLAAGQVTVSTDRLDATMHQGKEHKAHLRLRPRRRAARARRPDQGDPRPHGGRPDRRRDRQDPEGQQADDPGRRQRARSRPGRPDPIPDRAARGSFCDKNT